MHSNLNIFILFRNHSLLRLAAQKHKYDLISIYMNNPIQFTGVAPNCQRFREDKIQDLPKNLSGASALGCLQTQTHFSSHCLIHLQFFFFRAQSSSIHCLNQQQAESPKQPMLHEAKLLEVLCCCRRTKIPNNGVKLPVISQSLLGSHAIKYFCVIVAQDKAHHLKHHKRFTF